MSVMHTDKPKMVAAAATLLVAGMMTGIIPVESSTAAPVVPPGPRDDSALDGPARDLLARQAPLSSVANRIRDAEERIQGSGFAGVLVDAASRRLTIYWKGAVPREIADIISDGRRSGTDLAIEPAKFSRDELSKARFDLLADEKNRRVPESARTTYIQIHSDGSGLTIGSAVVAPTEQVRKAANPFIKAQIRSAGTVSLTRWDDSPPYYGGAMIRIRKNDGVTYYESCSTGFSTFDSAGRQWMVTAAHCIANSAYHVYNGSYRRFMGFATGIPERDLAVVRVDSNAGRMYDGAYDNPNGFNKPVKGWIRNNTGEYLCTSGSFSGVACNVLIEDDDITLRIGGFDVPYLVQARQLSFAPIAGVGDSGGPTFGHVPNTGIPYSDILARGIISQGFVGSEKPCTGYKDDDRRKNCYFRIAYMPISVALNNVGHYLRTTP